MKTCKKLSFLCAIFFLFASNKTFAQDKPPVTFGKVAANDFVVQSTLVDINTNAVIIADVATTSFVGNEKGWFSYVYKRSRRIKILHKNGVGMATVEINLYKTDDDKEEVSNLSGVTYNMENDKVVEVKLSSKDIFEQKQDKNHFSKKFTMPAVKEGSIIEYAYTIKSSFEYNLPAWEFQSATCPTLWSEYNVTIPNMLSYMSVFQGYHSFFIDKAGDGVENFSIKSTHSTNSLAGNRDDRLSVTSPVIRHRWVMKNLPVFSVENYIFSPRNLVDKISFQLYQTYDGDQYHDVSNNWKKLSEELMKRPDFGEPLDEDNEWLDEVLSPIVKQGNNLLQTARDIYYYVQHNYTCTNRYDKYIKTTLRDVVKKKSGTVGDINLLLAAMLKRKGIDAKPVLLSTREFGYNNPSYPLMERLNYVLCKIKINGIDYYLDATRPLLEFGKLPLQCYNGHAREISKDTVPVYFSADNIRETQRVIVFIVNNDKGEVDGTNTELMGFYKSLDTKNNIAASSITAYKKELSELYPKEYFINNIEVDSFQSHEGQVLQKFDFKLSGFSDQDVVYFNPLMAQAMKTNPFFAAERIYPVEMPYTSTDIFTLNMEIPKGYKVDELPQSCRLKLNEDEGSFEYIINSDGSNIQLRQSIILNKATFTNTDYQTLRDFYAYIVKKQAEQIVFKKIK